LTSTCWSWPVASRRNQGEPDGLARRARQAIKDQAIQISATRRRGPQTAAQNTPVWTPPTSQNPTLVAAQNGGYACVLPVRVAEVDQLSATPTA
jgi:hypothetical protein